MTVWVLIIVAGLTSQAGRAIDASLSFRSESECREAAQAIAGMDNSVGIMAFYPARATCIKLTKD